MWSTGSREKRILRTWKKMRKVQRNNKGMTLVELLVALAISAIVLTGVCYMIFFVLRLYNRTNANVEIQNESQTALNLVIDSILGAKGVCLEEWDSASLSGDEQDNIYCVLFGTLQLNGDKTMSFTGDAILWQPSAGEMYLMSGVYELGSYTDKSKAPGEALTAMKGKLPAAKEDRLPYLMAQYVRSFDIRTEDFCFVEEEESDESHYFENPLAFQIHMEFEYTYQSDKTVTRVIEDSAYIRNRLQTIFVRRLGSSEMLQYLSNPN